MAQTSAIVSALKLALKARGITYQQVAEELQLSEASVKRLFAGHQFSLKRLDQICALLGIEISDLVRQLDPVTRIDQLSHAGEQELVSDIELMLVAVCALNHWSFQQILDNYSLDEHQLTAKLCRLDRMGLIELLPGNRIKVLISHDFHWQDNGPIQQFFESQVQADFLHSHFNRPGELRLFVHGMLSPHSNDIIHNRIKRLALDFRHCRQEDQSLPLEQRFGVSMVLAIRPWEVSAFRDYRRPGARKLYPGHD